ncbi:hypothetical protein ABH909_002414 [Pseudomonas sp. BS3782 TE3695]
MFWQNTCRGIDAVFRRCIAIITLNVPEEKTWIPD